MKLDLIVNMILIKSFDNYKSKDKSDPNGLELFK